MIVRRGKAAIISGSELRQRRTIYAEAAENGRIDDMLVAGEEEDEEEQCEKKCIHDSATTAQAAWCCEGARTARSAGWR